MPRHDLAGVDADAGLDAELGQGVAHLDRGSAGPQRVVLVHLRNPEDGHDRVADELLHRAAVRLDDRLHPLEVAGEERAQRLGVGRLAECGRAGDVAEEDGDGLALQVRHGATLLRREAGTSRSKALHDDRVCGLGARRMTRDGADELVPVERVEVDVGGGGHRRRAGNVA